MNIRLIQIDGKLPNLALMGLAHWHRARGNHVTLTRRIEPDLFEPSYDRVYASTIFAFSVKRTERVRQAWPEAVIGGTGSLSLQTVEQLLGSEIVSYDYSDYPEFKASLGFTQRGCRLKCKFCVVPAKEGKPSSVSTIADIWRGTGHPKHLHLLDNDFFGQPHWRERIAEIRDGGFKVCLNQGINVRLIDDEAAEALASIEYRDDSFSRRCLYTAWDNLKDEKVFFRGVDRLERAGIPPTHLMAYMLIGFDSSETWERILYRFEAMNRLGIRPYPMVYDRTRKDLKKFQKWVVMRYHEVVPFADFIPNTHLPSSDQSTLAFEVSP